MYIKRWEKGRDKDSKRNDKAHSNNSAAGRRQKKKLKGVIKKLREQTENNKSDKKNNSKKPISDYLVGFLLYSCQRLGTTI